MEKKEKKKLSLKDIGIVRLGLIVLAGAVLIICSLPFGQSDSGESDEGQKNQTGADTAGISSVLSYGEQLEKRIESLLSKVEGVGRTSVMVNISSSSEVVLKEDISLQTEDTEETDSQGGSRIVTERSENRTVIYTVDSSGREIPYVITEKMPVIEGVAVVAEGGGDAVVRAEIVSLLEALLHLEANQISVSQMEMEE